MPKRDAAYIDNLCKGFRALIDDPEVTEPQIQDYMERNSELIPLPTLLGHDLHMGCVIAQFELDRCRFPDFAYLTKNTGFWRLVLVEIERPQKAIFTKADRAKFTAEADEAVSQVAAWKLFLTKHPEYVRYKLAALLAPEAFRENIIEVKYALVIGRDPKPPYTGEQKGRLYQLQKESDITFMTYDSILRMAASGNHRVGYPKNIIVNHRNAYRMKYVNVERTQIFAWYGPDQIQLTADQIQWYKDRNYDMDAWLSGERLVVNGIWPQAREKEYWEKLVLNAGPAPSSIPNAVPPGTIAPPILAKP